MAQKEEAATWVPYIGVITVLGIASGSSILVIGVVAVCPVILVNLKTEKPGAALATLFCLVLLVLVLLA